MYDGILVPTDGSESSQAAVGHGVALADRFDATVHFLYVVDVGTEMSASAVGDIADELTNTLESMANDALESATTRAEEAGATYDETILEGVPHDAIAEYSTDHNINLIIMGASGQSGITERLLGSTTDRVTRSVDTSVLIARP